jgi:hypothetical protein
MIIDTDTMRKRKLKWSIDLWPFPPAIVVSILYLNENKYDYSIIFFKFKRKLMIQ